MSELRLTGFRHSVYTCSVRIALSEKGVAYAYEECDPFQPQGQEGLRALHPFGRVPVLQHEGFRLYETAAILGYVNEAFAGPELMPQGAKARARARQVIAIADSYVYQPLVRDAFSHAVYRPMLGEKGDAEVIARGLEAAPAMLDALEEIAAEGLVLQPKSDATTDGHLFAMLDYFVMVDEGQAMIAARPNLSTWFTAFAARPSAIETKPDLGALTEEQPT